VLLAALLAHQVVVVDELVAVIDQQVARRVLHAQADHLLVVLAQLADQRRKVAVARDDHKDVDVRFRVTKVERVHDQANVGRVFPGVGDVGNLDQLERPLVQLTHRRAIAVPVAVGLLDDDIALVEQALQHELDIEARIFRVAHA
jgi:hypothetical protein